MLSPTFRLSDPSAVGKQSFRIEIWLEHSEMPNGRTISPGHVSRTPPTIVFAAQLIPRRHGEKDQPLGIADVNTTFNRAVGEFN